MLSTCFRRLCCVSVLTALSCFSVPVLGDTSSGAKSAAAIDNKKLSLTESSRHYMLSGGLFNAFGWEVGIKRKLSSHWSVGLHVMEIPDILTLILKDTDATVMNYAITGRYYIGHKFASAAFYIAPSAYFLTTDTGIGDSNVYFNIYDLNVGFQWPIAHRFGLDLSTGVMANLFGEQPSDGDSRVGWVIRGGFNFFI